MEILTAFGQASGLITSASKSAVYPIQCDHLDVEDIMQWFHCQIKSFPCTYLGLPLHIKRLRRVDLQPLIDKMATRLPTWKSRLLNKARHLRLMNSVMSSMLVHFLTVFALKKWAIKIG